MFFSPRKIFPLFALVLALFLSGCATRHKVVVEPEEATLKEICEQYTVDWQWDSVTRVVTLNKNGITASALVGSDVVVVAGEKSALSAPLKLSQNAIIVPVDFKRVVIDRLIERPAGVAAIRKFKEVIVDAGHGGKDPGAISRRGLQEKTVVLDIAKRLRENLESKGIKVIMTRSKDEFISLKGRTEIACRSKADLFVSVHANSSKDRKAEGVEVYYLRDLNSAEKRDPELKANHKLKYRNLAVDKNSRVVEGILSDLMYSYKQDESKRLAQYLSRKATNIMNAENRGSKTAGFFVLRNTLIPAVLVEVGFVTNAKEEERLKTGSYRQKIADSLAESILDYADNE